jgi:hypothetical protein
VNILSSLAPQQNKHNLDIVGLQLEGRWETTRAAQGQPLALDFGEFRLWTGGGFAAHLPELHPCRWAAQAR